MLSGASSLRGFYTSGILMCRPDEDRPERKLFFELRNGPAIEPRIVDKVDGQWLEIDRRGERLVRREHGEKLDAERRRKHDVILQLLYDEAAEGRVYTGAQFADRFENQAGLGGEDTIRERLGVHKEAVIAAVRALGFGPADDNEADALALLHWALRNGGPR